jgi:hypothetical protein
MFPTNRRERGSRQSDRSRLEAVQPRHRRCARGRDLRAPPCAAHDYALFNANSRHPSRQHAFNFTADDHTPLVVLPRRAWNGSYDASTPIAPEETTVVNLRALGDLCEEVVANLRQLHERQRLGITIDLAEFMVRYGLYYRP